MAQQLPGLRVPLMTTRRHPHHLRMQGMASSSSICLHTACCRPVPGTYQQLRASPRRCYNPNQDRFMEPVLDITAAGIMSSQPALGSASAPEALTLSSTALHLPSLAGGSASAVDQLVAVPVAAMPHVTAAAAAAGVVPEGVLDPDSANPAYNRSGLNGLTSGGTSGLDSGAFTVTSSMPVQYTVTQVNGIFDLNNKALLRGVVPGSFPFVLAPEPQQTVGLRRLIILDDNVHRIYGPQLEKYLSHHGVEYKLLVLPTCEENKELHLVTTIAEAIEEFKINRRQEPLIAIGGGVCLDVAGLAANLYRRNTGIIKVPTTLMAVVDASIGIKTAINFHSKKNKLGTYCPPLGVFYDTAFLNTLDGRNLSNGSAEVLKMACIKDGALFELMEAHAEELLGGKYQGPVASRVVRRSIQGMLEELEYNLWEHILVRLVDYGHTFSPDIEMAALRTPNMLLHGEAVNIDMALTTVLSAQRGLLTAGERDRVLGLMTRLGLPLWHQCCNIDLLVKGLKDMTLARDGLQRVPLMNGIGAARFVYDITRSELEQAAEWLVAYVSATGAATTGGAGVSGVSCVSGATGNNVLPWAHVEGAAAGGAAEIAAEETAV